MAQLAARLNGIEEVVGSTPIRSTPQNLAVAGGDFAGGSRGKPFFGPLAQLVERYTRIVEVSGSIPLRSTFSTFCGYLQIFAAHDCLAKN